MNWPDDFINKIICGDNLSVMKKMPDESIDMAMTSPPYWGLRDYGIEQIFGGDPDCKHEWIEEKMTLQHENRNLIIGTQEQAHKKKGTTFIKKYDDKKAGLCNKCGSWRGQLGLESTPEFYIEHLTEIFNELRRILKKEGTLWLNMGDTYWSAKGTCFNPGGGKNSIETKRREIYPLNRGKKSTVPNLPQKSLTMIPERLAWSLIQNGWILRNKIIWHKPNPMPSSVKDRFSNRWEYIFFFSKSNKPVYWTNKKTLQLVTKNPLGIKGKEGIDWEWQDVESSWQRPSRDETFRLPSRQKSTYATAKLKKVSLWTAHDYYFDLDAIRAPYTEPLDRWGGDKKKTTDHLKKDSPYESAHREREMRPDPAGKNPGDIFEINTQAFPEAHFAVFPERLCEKPIKAGCPEELCKKCGKAKERIIEKIDKYEGEKKQKADIPHLDIKHGKGRTTLGHTFEGSTTGWTSCECNAGFESGIVLDPFAGAGTALYVAKQLKRKFIGIDIKKEYCELAEKRLAQGVL